MSAIRSMTGFGSGVAEAGDTRAQVEIRCVNNRGLKVSVRSRPMLGAAEKNVRDRLGASLQRGSVDVSVSLMRMGDAIAPVLRADIAQKVVDDIRQAADSLGLVGDISPSDLIQIPGVFELPQGEVLSEAEVELVLQAVDAALMQVIQMREAEGEATARRLHELAEPIAELKDKARAMAPQVVERAREKLAARLEELCPGGVRPCDTQSLEREVCQFADRADINEELDRLGSHLEQYDAILTKGGAVGKHLEFLAQEIGREINTCASKANDTDITNLTIQAKLANESIREQVANLE